MEPLPQFVVAALVFIRQGDGILLVRQSYGAGYWSLPGGVVKAGESIEEAARREVREEAGLGADTARGRGILHDRTGSDRHYPGR
jgi:8-oxo-dGTP pyrophosphatase MutT (NUDIX family)